MNKDHHLFQDELQRGKIWKRMESNSCWIKTFQSGENSEEKAQH